MVINLRALFPHKQTVDDQFFRDLASNTESSWEELAKLLGFEEAEIKQIQTNSQDNKERSLQMLLSWWRKQTNREEGFQRLRDALNSIGRADLVLMIPSDEQQRMKQLGHRDQPHLEVQLEGAKEQSKQKVATSSEDQGPRHMVGHRDKPKQEVQVGGAKEQSKQKGFISSEDQRPGQEKVVHRDEPQSEIQVEEESKQKGSTASEEQRPRHKVHGRLHRHETGAVEEQGIQKHIRPSDEEPRPSEEEVGHREKLQSEVKVKEESRQTTSTTSEVQRPEHEEQDPLQRHDEEQRASQEEVGHPDKPQSEVQEKEESRQKGSTTCNRQRPGHEEQDHLQRHDEEQRPSQEEVGHRDTVEVQNQVAGAGEQNSPNVSSQSPSFKNRFKRSVLSLLPKRKKAREQKLGQEQMGDKHSRQADIQRAGFHKERKTQEGTSSSDGLCPKQEYVVHRDKLQQDVFVEGVKEQSKQKGTTSIGDQRLSREEFGHEAKPEPKEEVREAKEQRQLKGTTPSEGQIQNQREAGGTEPSIQKERVQSSEDYGLKRLTHQNPSHGQVDVAPRKPSEIQETLVRETTSQVGQLMQSPSSVQDIAPVGLQLGASSPSAAVLRCGPVQVQHVSVDSMHIGGANKPTFLGPVNDPTFTIIQNVAMPESSPAEMGRAKSSPSDSASQCRSELKDRYTATVLGLRKEDIGQYVRRFFSKKLDIAEGLLDRIQSSDVLSDLSKSPMFLLLMCLLWREKYLDPTLAKPDGTSGVRVK
ncbi:putative mediator of RNA polymerase II transcription subunit 26 [Patiria miniata]|uniref:Death domain-containing protein n=1 Tax=Patiria miniata TaxID=46514 RepID=A0A913ZPC8_PATMI|nr:putative mediator of RNA polymerase II transcription subunit 26 [Patiria miniata]